MKLPSFFKAIFIILSVIAVERFCHYQTAGFTILKMTSSLPFNEQWNVEPIADLENQNILAILNQKFRFLGGGGSFYAFSSEDEKYVIKFFKHHHLKRNPIKYNRVFQSCKLAFNAFREETGLLLVHLNKTQNQYFPLIIIDKIGIEHRIDLDRTEFLLQKKAHLISDRIVSLMHRGDSIFAQQILNKLMQFCVSMTRKLNEKGYYDHDPNLFTNYGLVDEQIIKIDVGPFIAKEKSVSHPNKLSKKSLKQFAYFNQWLESDYPELAITPLKDIDVF